VSQNIKKRILVAAIHYPIASGRYIARALRRMGHDVKTVGPYAGRDVWGMQLPEGSEWKPDWLIDEDLQSLSEAMERFHSQPPVTNSWTPDLIINADSAYRYQVIHYVGQQVVFGVDNHVRDYRMLGNFDHLFLAHSTGYRMGEPNVTWLPCAYDPELHYVEIPWDQRPFHAAMIGVVYKERAQIINKMAEAGLRVLAGTGAILDAYRANYNQALIGVCRSIKGDMAQRVFETAAMGCLILSDKVPDMEKLGMVDGVHYVGYKTPEEATARALEIVNEWEPERVKAMIDASLEWVKPHTWDARCQTILEVIGL
jgi:hypothetical protein